MNPDSERELVEAAQSGHLESFGILYERYHSSMVALAYSMLADKEMAEDAAQEVFAAACRDIASLKSKEKFAAWLAGICRNISRQMLRSKSKGTAPAGEKMVASSLKDEDCRLRTAINQALGQLPPAERELIVLRYYDNLPYERIASILDISVQAVNG
ncbi:MAG: sigma-70 family RNA polymerase sigma factor, partial [Sedimentisphaerales bacterium]|nr:sigma-70 family RNA polymerase sigma factor [Sedimentisphaerales bacterium]